MKYVLAFLIGYLGASVVVPCIDVYRATAGEEVEVVVIGKYEVWNRVNGR